MGAHRFEHALADGASLVRDAIHRWLSAAGVDVAEFLAAAHAFAIAQHAADDAVDTGANGARADTGHHLSTAHARSDSREDLQPACPRRAQQALPGRPSHLSRNAGVRRRAAAPEHVAETRAAE